MSDTGTRTYDRERAPLLNKSGTKSQDDPGLTSDEIQNVEANKNDRHGQGTIPAILSEAAVLMKSSIPLVCAYLLQYSLSLVVVIVAGRLGALETAAASLASMTSNIIGVAIYDGLAAALDTLCAQAYGAGRQDMVGVHVQRMIHLMLLITIPIGVAWVTSIWWLRLVTNDPEVALLSGRLMAVLLVGNPGYVLFESGRRFVQAQGLFRAPMYVMLAALPTTILFAWLFSFKASMGLLGAGLGLAVARTLFPVFLIIYVLTARKSILQCWSGWERFSPKKWSRMIKLAIPSMFIVEAEVFIFQFLIIAGTYLTRAESASMSVMSTLVFVVAHIPLAMGISIATRLGHLVGSGKERTAKSTMLTGVGLSVIAGVIDGALIYVLKEPIINAFTADSDVADFCRQSMPVIAVLQIANHATGVTNGMLRGLGKQNRGALINIAIFVFVGVPASLSLCFGPPKLGLVGLWLGVMIAYFLIATVVGIYGLTFDMGKAVQAVRAFE